MPVVLRTGRQLARLASRRRDQPDVAVGLVFRLVRLRDDVGNRFAIRRDLGIAEALNAEEIVELDRARDLRGEKVCERAGGEN